MFGGALEHRAQQPSAATLRGIITDPAGAVVVGASVKATHVATKTARDTETNDEGVYVLTNL
ncbi:MAG TPA: carboxypeptidase-like regulatory domain-containing protein, partial [Pyrinomonadaceae bacterium]|nr:carboxypeptidase-like regulatory domain-containing protein [Pyrinomonadaceae bacterium]